MHAVVVRVSISDPQAGLSELREEVVPQVSKAPGFVAGYWTRSGNSGLAMVVFESEAAANEMSERVKATLPAAVTFESIEVREVVAHA